MPTPRVPEQRPHPVFPLQKQVGGPGRTAQLGREALRLQLRGRRLDPPGRFEWLPQFTPQRRGHEACQGRMQRVEHDQAVFQALSWPQQAVKQAGEDVRVPFTLHGPLQQRRHRLAALRGGVEGVEKRAHRRRILALPGHAAHRNADGQIETQAMKRLGKIEQGGAGDLLGVVVLAGDPVHRNHRRVRRVQLAGQQNCTGPLVDAVGRAAQHPRLLPGDHHRRVGSSQPREPRLQGRGEGSEPGVIPAQGRRERGPVQFGPERCALCQLRQIGRVQAKQAGQLAALIRLGNAFYDVPAGGRGRALGGRSPVRGGPLGDGPHGRTHAPSGCRAASSSPARSVTTMRR